ncbi:hypothetical protein KHM83_13335 [Fusibacter paucivorans]|uniref:DUF4830 domain-containing protein n=1 Tax=Fusibacter paucivorans TaxID=76009 RepID=A0ABS5PR76_9FIRM|nr:hypothetical protein [Fusibacter paucivorans]MBS7527663.1 hypothetical protein [Fusibacter paucivorans]
MSKKIMFFLAGILLLTIILLTIQPWYQKPFKDIEAADIESATVQLIPPDVTLTLDEEVVNTLVELLHTVEIGREDDTYFELVGQSVIYTITMTDGTILNINAVNPYIGINGVGYLCRGDASDALGRLGNRIRQ